ncbi:FAD:protein FMN transferase [Petrachloros mirabilis]
MNGQVLSALFLGLYWVAVSGCHGFMPLSEPITLKRAQTHMGTLVTVTAVAPTRELAQVATTAAFEEIHRLEQLLSTWIPTSELSKVNAAAGKGSVAVSPETLVLVRRAMEVAKMTEGTFNIAIGPALDVWNVTEQSRVPSEAGLERLKPLVDLRALHVDVGAGTISLDKAGMRIDVGGIGKGYAADQAVMAMQKAGAIAGVVALSGDIKTFGRLPGEKKFPVGIQHPRKEGAVLAWIELQDEAISTAGDYERFFEKDGIRYHHILDPATLQPARGCQSVSVIAKEGVWADGLDTGIFVMGPERGMKLVEQLENVEAIIVDQSGKVHVSSGLRKRIHFPEANKQGGLLP